jgi:hypothetical protein
LKRNYKILLIVVIALILAGAGYYAYNQYNLSKTQGYLKTSLNHQNAANDYLNQANQFENKNNYAQAIVMQQKGADEITKALENDNDASPYAEGIYQDYLNNDLLLLQATSKLIEYEIYVNHYKTNDLNPGQEKVDPNTLTPYIDGLKTNISSYKDKENQIISANPEKFQFLKG